MALGSAAYHGGFPRGIMAMCIYRINRNGSARHAPPAAAAPARSIINPRPAIVPAMSGSRAPPPSRSTCWKCEGTGVLRHRKRQQDPAGYAARHPDGPPPCTVCGGAGRLGQATTPAAQSSTGAIDVTGAIATSASPLPQFSTSESRARGGHGGGGWKYKWIYEWEFRAAMNERARNPTFFGGEISRRRRRMD